MKARGEDAASLDGLGTGLFEFATFAGGAAVAAALLVVLVERAGLHWSTPLILLPVAGISLAVEPAAGAAIGGAFIAATGVALARHQQSVERGGPEARRARERVGAISRVKATVSRRRAEIRRTDGARLVLGVRRDHGLATVPIGIHQGVRGFVPGAPGSGKTVTLAAHASAYVRAGMAAIVVDPKGDDYLRETLVAEAERAGKQLVEWSPDGPTSYNPLGQGSPSEIADKALAAETYTEPHYLRQAQRYLGLMLRAMQEVGEWPPSLSAVVGYFEPDRLEYLTRGCDEVLASHVASYLRDMSPRARAELTGTRDRLAILAESELGRWTEPGQQELDLADVLARRNLGYVRLDADRFPLASQMLGAALVVDLVTISAGLHGGRPSGLVVIDEFAALAAEQISRLLSRSRSAGISVLIGTQSFADLTVARPDDHTDSLRRQVLANVDYVVAHRQSEPEAAEILASMAGTEPAWSVTRHTRAQLGASRPADEGTRTRTREFVCHPDEFKGLGVGEAIVIEPISGRQPTVASIWMPPTAVGGAA